MGAMSEEVNGIEHLLTGVTEYTHGMRTYYNGHLNGIETVVVFSRWGKVAAAATVSTLILEFKITELIFTGVAGAIHHELKIGDIVIGKRLIQHDMDARPIMKRHEIPLLGTGYIDSPAAQIETAQKAISAFINTQEFISEISKDELSKFGITKPNLFIGDIASGDQFFSNEAQKHQLLAELPSILCVEMEGAAVAQVCYEYEIPFTIIRTISDTADEHSEINFPEFITEVSSKYSIAIVRDIFKTLNS